MSEEDIKLRLGTFNENNISEVLNKWHEVNKLTKQLSEDEEYLRNKVKVFMKEKGWDKYNDDTTKINISITSMKRENVDFKNLRLLITPQQYAQIVSTTTYEKMLIITPEMKNRLKQFVKVKRI